MRKAALVARRIMVKPGRYKMVGKRQHFIPQFLLRGFLTSVQRSQEYTCVYRRGSAPFQTNIKNVGIEGFFYSAVKNDADGVITNAENGFGRLLDELRMSDGDLPDVVRLAELFAHLEARSRHLRQSFLQTGTHLIDVLLHTVSDSEVFKPYVRRMLREDPSLLEDAFSEELRKHGLPQALLPMIMRQAGALVEQALPNIAAQMAATATHLRAELPHRFRDAAKVGHIRALEREVSPAKKAVIFSALQFKVTRFPEASLPLGDSMVVFHVRGDPSFKPFLEKGDELVAAILPIATDTALVGATKPYDPDLGLFRYEIVRCSLEFFIAGEESERNANLSYRIGENAHLLSNGEVQELVRAITRG